MLLQGIPVPLMELNQIYTKLFMPLRKYHLAVAQLRVTQFQLELLPIQFHIILGIAERFSALGMALYSTCLYFALNIEFIHGYLAILIICHTISYAPSSYITLFSLALSTNIDLLCFEAYSSLTPGHHHGGCET